MLGSMVILLFSDQEVSDSIPGPTVGFFSGGKLFHGIYGVGVFVFQCPLSMLCPVLSWEASSALCLPQVNWGPSVVSEILYSVWSMDLPKPSETAINGVKEG